MLLNDLDRAAWAQLQQCADERSGALRNLTLSTVDSSNQPQSRILILRNVDTGIRTLWFHTDLRSRKWTELTDNPLVSVIGYDPDRQLQLRMSGTAQLHPPKTELTTKAWSGLPAWTRSTYCGGPPGEETNPKANVDTAVLTEAQTSIGYDVFCVVIIKVDILDWFSHPRGAIRRIHFSYGSDGSLQQALDVAP